MRARARLPAEVRRAMRAVHGPDRQDAALQAQHAGALPSGPRGQDHPVQDHR